MFSEEIFPSTSCTTALAASTSCSTILFLCKGSILTASSSSVPISCARILLKTIDLAKTATNPLESVIKTSTSHERDLYVYSLFCSLTRVGLCILGIGLFKTKYFAWVLTIILMLVAIVIDVVVIGFVSDSFSLESSNGSLKSADLVNPLIAVIIVHIFANGFTIFYLTKRSTAPRFKKPNS